MTEAKYYIEMDDCGRCHIKNKALLPKDIAMTDVAFSKHHCIIISFSKANRFAIDTKCDVELCVGLDSHMIRNFPITNLKGKLVETNSKIKTASVKTDDLFKNQTVQTKTRRQCLEDAVKCICSDRNNQYGEPEDNFKTIAEYWNTYLVNKKSLTAQDVANMMILFKLGRLTTNDGTYDTYVDIAGYAGCGSEILGNRNNKADEN